MKLSVCYIVKDELAELRRSLASVAGIADEIIIGATYGPVEREVAALGAEYGAEVIKVEWQKDFAAARNTVLDKAAGDWILFLDADEWFAVPPAVVRLREFLAQAAADAIALPMTNVEAEDESTVIAVMDALRLYKKIPGRCYAGKVHEHLTDNGRTVPGVLCRADWLRLKHTGYSASLLKAKGERNLPLLLEEMEKSDSPEKYYTYLAEAYEGLGRMAEAMHYARLDVARGRQSVAYGCRSYRILLRGLTGKSELLQERIRVATAAVQDYPELPELWAELATCYGADYDFAQAVAKGKQALQLWEKPVAGTEPVQFTAEMAKQLSKDLTAWERIIDLMPRLKIAACVIVKNEARDLPLWLAKSKEYADILCVTDTGSEDNTVRLAKEAGAKVSFFPWNNDFAAAKNYALSQVPEGMDWIMLLDADEYFGRPERVRARLAEICIEHPRAEVGFAQIINIDEVNHKELSTGTGNERMLKGSAGLKFIGKIHEHLQKEDGSEASCFFFGERMPIYHLGYSPQRMKAKAERNVALLLQQQREMPPAEQVRLDGYLAETWFALGNGQETIACARRFLASPYCFVNGGGELWHVYLQALRESRAPLEEFLQVVEKAITALPEMPELYLEKGMALCAQGRLEEAEELLFKAEELRNQSGQGMADGYMQQALPVYLCRLGELWLKLRQDKERAHVYLLASLGQNPLDAKSFALYYDSVEACEAEVILAELGEIYNDAPGRAFVFRQALRLGAIAVAEYYAADLPENDAAEARLWEYYQEGCQKGPVAVLQEAPKKLLAAMEGVILAMFSLGADLENGNNRKLWEAAIGLLPRNVQQVMWRWAGQAEETAVDGIDAAEAEAYQALLPWALKQGAEGRQLYASLAAEYGDEVRRDILAKLLAGSYWEEALVLLGTVAADSSAADKVFWQQAGLVLYNLERLEEAAGAFYQARLLGNEAKEIAFYEQELHKRGFCVAEEEV